MASPNVMAAETIFSDAVYFQDTVSLPDNCITDDQVSATAAVDAAKLDHQHTLSFRSLISSSVVATDTKIIHIAKAAGQLIEVKACLITANTGDATVTIDIKKSTSAGAFATMLDEALVLDTAPIALTSIDATVGSTGETSYIADDLIEITVVADAGGGALGKGLCVLAYVREAA